MAYLTTYILTAGQVDRVDANNLSTLIIDSGSVDEFTNILYTEGSQVFDVYGKAMLDKPALDIVVSDYFANNFPEYQAKKNGQIDAKTGNLIALGYTYDTDKQFSLSAAAQSNLIDYYSMKADVSIYPIRLNTIDDTDAYNIIDEADLIAVHLAAFSKIREHTDSGTALKDSVRLANNESEVDAINDPR